MNPPIETSGHSIKTRVPISTAVRDRVPGHSQTANENRPEKIPAVLAFCFLFHPVSLQERAWGNCKRQKDPSPGNPSFADECLLPIAMMG